MLLAIPSCVQRVGPAGVCLLPWLGVLSVPCSPGCHAQGWLPWAGRGGAGAVGPQQALDADVPALGALRPGHSLGCTAHLPMLTSLSPLASKTGRRLRGSRALGDAVHSLDGDLDSRAHPSSCEPRGSALTAGGSCPLDAQARRPGRGRSKDAGLQHGLQVTDALPRAHVRWDRAEPRAIQQFPNFTR